MRTSQHPSESVQQQQAAETDQREGQPRLKRAGAEQLVPGSRHIELQVALHRRQQPGIHVVPVVVLDKELSRFSVEGVREQAPGLGHEAAPHGGGRLVAP